MKRFLEKKIYTYTVYFIEISYFMNIRPVTADHLLVKTTIS